MVAEARLSRFWAWSWLLAGVMPGRRWKGRDMGCVWQSECALEPRFGEVRAPHRIPARHRKPPLWRRAKRAAGPRLTAVAAFCRVRWDSGGLAPQARLR